MCFPLLASGIDVNYRVYKFVFSADIDKVAPYYSDSCPSVSSFESRAWHVPTLTGDGPYISNIHVLRSLKFIYTTTYLRRFGQFDRSIVPGVFIRHSASN